MTTVADLRKQFPQYETVSDGDFLMGLHRKLYPNVHPRRFLDAIEGSENASATIRNKELRAWYREKVSAPLPGETEEQTALRLGGSLGPVGNPGGPIVAGARGALQGLTFGAGDEIVAAGASALSGVPYDQALQAERDRLELGRQQNPVAAYGGEIAGAVAVPLGAATVGANALANMGRGAVTGAGLGSLYGYLAGEGGVAERAGNALSSGILGAAVGGAVPAVTALGSRIVQNARTAAGNREIVRSAPTMDQLRAQAGALYNQADSVMVPRAPFGQAVDDAVTQARRMGMDPDLTPGASTVASRMTDAADSTNPGMSFRELNTLREKAAIPAGNVMAPREAMLGTQFIEAIDDFVDSVDPATSAKVKQARDLWRRLAKSKKIEEILEKARNQASGYENGLRVQFRAILNSPKQRRGFSAAEIEAMQAVVRGTAFGNIMRKLGVFGLSAGPGGSGLGVLTGAGSGGTIGTLIAGPIGGVVGATVPALVGSGAKAIAERSTRNAADRVRALVAAGVNASPPGLAPATQSQVSGAATRAALPAAVQAEVPLPVRQRR